LAQFRALVSEPEGKGVLTRTHGLLEPSLTLKCSHVTRIEGLELFLVFYFLIGLISWRTEHAVAAEFQTGWLGADQLPGGDRLKRLVQFFVRIADALRLPLKRLSFSQRSIMLSAVEPGIQD